MNEIVPTAPGGWWWNGSGWVCGCEGSDGGGPPFGPPVFSGPTQQPPWYPGANGGVSFGASPPPNPVRGHMWWNGTTFYLFDGAAWVAFGGSGGGGTALGTTPPANPTPGQQWFNGSVLYVWDGTGWVPTTSTKSYVQPTAPPAPNPGDTWYDGTVMRIWDGTAWETVGPGALQGPVGTTTKVFQLTMAGTTATINGTSSWGIVNFVSTPSVDTENGWNATTKQFQPTKAGTYLFVTNQFVPYTQTDGGHGLIFNDSGVWNQNAQNFVTTFYNQPNTGDAVGAAVQLTGLVHMNGTTDFVRLWANGSPRTFYQISSTMPSIVGWLLP